MALTITEKNHWKERIAQRIDKRINQIKCSNPELFQKISEKAKAAAIKTAKIEGQISRADEIDLEIKRLDSERDKLLGTAYSTLFGKDSWRSYSVRSDIDSRIAELQLYEKEALMQESEIGRQVASLMAEKESLLDTVWLATSPRQVTDLWQKALKLLGEETTAFQQEILSSAGPLEN